MLRLALILLLLGHSHVMAASIVTFGTSLTAYGQWQPSLEQALEACTGQDWQIINSGASSMASDWGMANADRVYSTSPDVALIEFATNDAYAPYAISVAQSRLNTLAIIDAIRVNSPATQIFLMTMNPTIRDASRPHLTEYFRQYRSIAQEAGVGLIDLFPVWRKSLTLATAERSIPDGVHPSASAYSAVVPVIAEAVLGQPC